MGAVGSVFVPIRKSGEFQELRCCLSLCYCCFLEQKEFVSLFFGGGEKKKNAAKKFLPHRQKPRHEILLPESGEIFLFLKLSEKHGFFIGNEESL